VKSFFINSLSVVLPLPPLLSKIESTSGTEEPLQVRICKKFRTAKRRPNDVLQSGRQVAFVARQERTAEHPEQSKGMYESNPGVANKTGITNKLTIKNL
jgi:hypothetical protein